MYLFVNDNIKYILAEFAGLSPSSLAILTP